MRNIFVFGASSSIAQEVIRLYAERKFNFFLAGRNYEKLEIIRKDAESRGAKKVEVFTADALDFQRHEEIFKKAKESLGVIDIAFIAHGQLDDQEACENDYKAVEGIYRINLLSVISILTPLIRYFEGKKKGQIAVITSVAGDRGKRRNAIYASAKGGLDIYLEGLRNRLASSGISVLTIKPGFVNTPMTAKMKKGLLFVSPEFVAKEIVKAMDKKKEILYIPWFWKWIMMVLRMIPETIFKKTNL